MEPYTKVKHGYFPDFCDRTVRGKLSDGSSYNFVTTGIVSNSMKWVDNLSGWYNPAWKAQVRRRQDATTPMSATGSTVDARRMVAVIMTRSVGDSINYRETRLEGYPLYAIPATSTVPASVLSAARNQALAKFLSRANAIRTSVEGGQALGEWKETYKAITNPLGALRQFTVRHVLNAKKRLRRLQNSHGGRARGARHPSSSRKKAMAAALSDTYLEFVFGWIPLAKDIQGAIAGLLDRYDQPDRVMIKGKAEVGWDESSDSSDIFNADGIICRHNRLTVSSIDYRFRASISTGAVNGVRSVSSTLGFLPERFIPTVWELIPYSFVVDYFVNVGDIIESYAFRRSSIEWGHRTIKIKSSRTYSVPYMIFDPTLPAGYYPGVRRLIQMGATGGNATVDKHSVDRVSIFTDNLYPDLEIHLPISGKPWLNLGALLTQKFCSL